MSDNGTQPCRLGGDGSCDAQRLRCLTQWRARQVVGSVEERAVVVVPVGVLQRQAYELDAVLGVRPLPHPLDRLVVDADVGGGVGAVLHLVEALPQGDVQAVGRRVPLVVLVVEAALRVPRRHAPEVLPHLLGSGVQQHRLVHVVPGGGVRVVADVVGRAVAVPVQPVGLRGQVQDGAAAVRGSEEVQHYPVQQREVPVRVVLRRVARHLYRQPVRGGAGGAGAAEQRSGRGDAARLLPHAALLQDLSGVGRVACGVGLVGRAHAVGSAERGELHLLDDAALLGARQLR